MSKQETPITEKFVVRLPNGMRQRIASVAKRYHRSMNSEIVSRLEDSLDLETTHEKVSNETRESSKVYKTLDLEQIENLDLQQLSTDEKTLIILILRLPKEKQRALSHLLK